MRRYAVVGMIVLLLVPVGCEKETSDDRLVDIAVSQKKHERRIEELERRLVEIRQSIEETGPATGAPATVGGKEGGALDFRNTQEYAQIVASLSDVQRRLEAAQSSLSQTQQNLARQRELGQLRDPRQAFQAMNDPQEMDRRLTLLAQNFAGRIQDAAKRQQFEADVQQLRQSFATPASVDQLYQRRTAELTARLNEEQDERRRQFIERELTSLQTATAEELQQRLERYQRSATMRGVRELQQTYNIPRETLREAGLPTMGGMGPGTFRGGRGRGR